MVAASIVMSGASEPPSRPEIVGLRATSLVFYEVDPHRQDRVGGIDGADGGEWCDGTRQVVRLGQLAELELDHCGGPALDPVLGG